MSVTNRENAKDCNVLILTGLRLHYEVRTLTGTTVLGENCAPVQYLDPGGAARNVDLPDAVNGTIIVIRNTADAAGEVITVRNSAAGTIGTVTSGATDLNEVGWFHRVNGAWRVMQIHTIT